MGLDSQCPLEYIDFAYKRQAQPTASHSPGSPGRPTIVLDLHRTLKCVGIDPTSVKGRSSRTHH